MSQLIFGLEHSLLAQRNKQARGVYHENQTRLKLITANDPPYRSTSRLPHVRLVLSECAPPYVELRRV